MSNIITIPCGQIQGTECQWPGVTAYKGIRYATAGRWEYPVEVTKWDGVYDASAYGNCSFQPRAFYDEETRTVTWNMGTLKAFERKYIMNISK